MTYNFSQRRGQTAFYIKWQTDELIHHKLVTEQEIEQARKEAGCSIALFWSKMSRQYGHRINENRSR